MISFSDAERRHIEDFYKHRKLVLQRIQAVIEREKQERKRRK